MATGASVWILLFLTTAIYTTISGQNAGGTLPMYVDPLPKIPVVLGYYDFGGVVLPKHLIIGMYQKKWKFHRDLPETTVFVYGTSESSASFPGPVIETIQGVSTYVTWLNYLPDTHILPWDPSILVAETRMGGVPTVAHLHGGIHEAYFDGNPYAWFTQHFRELGPNWSRLTYLYSNDQHPGNLWYHDHALGLTRQNLLAGLLGPYVIRNPAVEDPLMLPSGPEFDRHLVIADRSFYSNGSIYMNATGNNPDVHPQWQPEYFGDAITVNGKAWPYLVVYRRKYRFRILNASNARYLHLQFSNGMDFTVIGSDASYLAAPIITREIYSEVVGSPYYVAPEVLLKSYGPEIDVWSAGIILYILLSGVPPFWAENEAGIFKEILKGPLDLESEPWPEVSQSAKDLIKKMLERNPKKRYTVHDVLCHPWILDDNVAPDRPMDSAVLSRLHHFSQMNRLKKMALRFIIEKLLEEEIGGLKELFKMIDGDNNGIITFKELKQSLQKDAISQLTEIQIQSLMDAADTNSNGTIEYSEFIAATLHMNKVLKEENLKSAFSFFDKDETGYITINQLKKAGHHFGLNDGHLDDMNIELNQNYNGRIDYNEFAAMMKNGNEAQ